MTDTDKWDGLLGEAPCGPPPARRTPTITAILLLAALLAVAAVWLTVLHPQDPGAHGDGHTPTTPAAAPSTTPSPSPTTPPVAPTPSAPLAVDVFAPAKAAADAWIHAYMDDRVEGEDWALTYKRLPATTREYLVYLRNVKAAQTSGVIYGARVTAIAYTEVEADRDNPGRWTTDVAIALDTGTTVTGRITLVARKGGWQTDKWEAQ